MITGENILSGAPDTCPDCGVVVKLKVRHSNAGYYVGMWCNCGPYSRESGFFKTSEEAETALDKWRSHIRTVLREAER